jgi:hypothetical protein
MKFFHVTTLFKIVGNSGAHSSSQHKKNPDTIFNEYKHVYELCKSSAEKYLEEENLTRIMFTGEVNHIQDIFRASLKNLYKIWKENYPCNILYTGPDVLFLKPVNFSKHFDKFMMFNYTAGHDCKSMCGFEHYFNADVKYYPSTMNEDLWKIALEMEATWPDYSFWDYEQIIWNKMLWSQNISITEALHQDYAYQFVCYDKEFYENVDAANNYNSFPLEKAKIAHFHNTRNLFDNYNIMKNILDIYGEK